jgi:hypothetical protein
MVDFSEIRFLLLKLVSGLICMTLFSASKTFENYLYHHLGLMKMREGTNYYE